MSSRKHVRTTGQHASQSKSRCKRPEGRRMRVETRQELTCSEVQKLALLLSGCRHYYAAVLCVCVCVARSLVCSQRLENHLRCNAWRSSVRVWMPELWERHACTRLHETKATHRCPKYTQRYQAQGCTTFQKTTSIEPTSCAEPHVARTDGKASKRLQLQLRVKRFME